MFFQTISSKSQNALSGLIYTDQSRLNGIEVRLFEKYLKFLKDHEQFDQ